ncbi:MAG: FkbM family methyltransferase [Polyangiales bacterium]
MNKWTYRWKKLREHPRPVRFVLSRLLWRTGLSPFFVLEMPHGFRIRFYPSSISAALWSDPESRSADEDFVWAVLRAGDRYIDAGANIGQLALAASNRVGRGGEVIAIEAHPEIFRFLEGNAELNHTTNLTTLHCALGAGPGEVALTTRRSDDQNYISDGGTVRVQMRTLDELVAPRPTRLLKLDVEGYELPVLQGATAVLDHTEIVYCELSTGNCRRFGYAPREVEQLLLGKGFVFVRTGDAGKPAIVTSEYFSSLPDESLPATGYNLVAVRPSVAQEVLQMLSAEGWIPVSEGASSRDR